MQHWGRATCASLHNERIFQSTQNVHDLMSNGDEIVNIDAGGFVIEKSNRARMDLLVEGMCCRQGAMCRARHCHVVIGRKGKRNTVNAHDFLTNLHKTSD